MSAARKLELENQIVVGIFESLAPNELIEKVVGSANAHAVQKNGIAFAQELITATTMIETPEVYLNDPMGTIFGPPPVDGPNAGKPRSTYSRKMVITEKKSDLLAQVGDFVAGVKGSRAIWDEALLIADELYTNSAKNGWAPGTKPFVGLPQTEGSAEFFAEADHERLVLGCRDTFGTLTVETVLDRISTCYKNGVADSIRRGTGGAGIGSYMIFEACIAYYAAVEPGKRSIVCVALPLGLSRRAASGLPKNIHLLSASLSSVEVSPGKPHVVKSES